MVSNYMVWATKDFNSVHDFRKYIRKNRKKLNISREKRQDILDECSLGVEYLCTGRKYKYKLQSDLGNVVYYIGLNIRQKPNERITSLEKRLQKHYGKLIQCKSTIGVYLGTMCIISPFNYRVVHYSQNTDRKMLNRSVYVWSWYYNGKIKISPSASFWTPQIYYSSFRSCMCLDQFGSFENL